MKICQYLRFYMKIIHRKCFIKPPFNFWDLRSRDMWKVCLETFRNNRIRNRIRNLQNSPANNPRILMTKNANVLGYCFYMSANIQGDFQICINVPLIHPCSNWDNNSLFWAWLSLRLNVSQKVRNLLCG